MLVVDFVVSLVYCVSFLFVFLNVLNSEGYKYNIACNIIFVKDIEDKEA